MDANLKNSNFAGWGRQYMAFLIVHPPFCELGLNGWLRSYEGESVVLWVIPMSHYKDQKPKGWKWVPWYSSAQHQSPQIQFTLMDKSTDKVLLKLCRSSCTRVSNCKKVMSQNFFLFYIRKRLLQLAKKQIWREKRKQIERKM